MHDPTPTATMPPVAKADRVDLVFVVDGRTLAYPLPAEGRVVVGRSAGDVVVAHASLSRQHAAITTPSLLLEDLGSTNGTWLRAPDGAAESRLAPGDVARLAPGDTARLGAVTMVLVPRPAEPATARPEALDPAMRDALALADRVAPSEIPVLLLGETGVGKEVLAERVHRASRRSGGPLLRLNCAALAEQLVESELFGHERGAFTGAHAAKPGLLEAASGGTVLLDEVGDLRLESQARLLRVIEEGKALRVGGVTPRPVDVRFLAATHKDLDAAVREGRFRRDLYYRLAGVAVRIPPLRERPAELLPLARGFLQAAWARAGRAGAPSLSADAVAWLTAHPWPGNIRELRHCVERSALLCEGAVVAREHLDPGPSPASPAAPAAPAATSRGRAGLTRAAIEAALDRCAGNQTRAAEALGVSRRTLVNWIERHGIARPRGGR